MKGVPPAASSMEGGSASRSIIHRNLMKGVLSAVPQHHRWREGVPPAASSMEEEVPPAASSMEGLCGAPLATLAATLARGDRAALADELRQLGATTVGARARLEGELLRAASAAEARRVFRESTLREGSESTLREGSESTLREGSESTLREGSESTLRGGIESTLREGMESTLREGSESTLREGIESTLREGSELTLRGDDVTSAARCGGAGRRGAPLLSPPAGWPSCYERASSGLKPFVAERLRGARVRLCARLSRQNAAPLAAVPLSATDARENARRVCAATGWQVLRGYAVFQLAARAEEREAAGEDGSAVYVARAWWWNVKPNGAWVDATPRGDDYPLVLVESTHDVASPAASAAEWEDRSKPAEGALHAAALSAEQQLFSLAAPMVVQVGEGLCNRLRALLSYREVALSQGRPLLVVWAVDTFCNGRFQDVFEPLPGVRIVESVSRDQVEYFATDTHPDIKRTPREAESYAPLRPNSRVRSAIHAQVQRMGSRFIALHVRRTDLCTVLPPARQTTDADFDRFIERHAPLPVYLATDNAGTQERFLREFKARVHVGHQIAIRKSLRQTSIFEAVVDIFCSAEAYIFKGSYHSSFSDTIAHIRKVISRSHAADEHALA